MIEIHIVVLVSLVRAASKYYDGPIRPYEFGFNIEGHQHRKESKDINGIVMGEFGFITADNVYHVTVYATDENGNFKIVSMKNYKLGPTAPPTTTSAPTTTPSTTTTTSTTPQPFRIITTANPQVTPKSSGYAACSGCKIPETTTVKPSTEPSLPETSTLYVPPFKIVNKNDIESVTTTSKPITTTPNESPKSSPDETPQKLVDNPSASKAPSSKESTKPQSPEDMQSVSKTPSTQSLQPPPSDGGGGSAKPNEASNAKPISSKPTSSSASGGNTSSSGGKLDHINTANMMIQHILNGLLYRFNYTVGYHGHHEQGDRQGNKEGGYFAVGRDGIRRGVTYKANEFGFQPHIKFEKVSPEETPREETEKQAGLKGFDFKWFWGES
ncbi:AAEL011451-PA [Aedes aegypti]|uniref:AAEL011451-PA n=1 Tax=Aedes aegypti TaxID=7159 RepID=Q16Q12_AEDAE|nr:AAEL011451-PA [Aedes aegypti]